MADGSRHSMYLVEESTYGETPASPVMAAIRHNTTSLGLSKSTLQSEEIRPDRQIAGYRHGQEQVGGDIVSELSYGSFDSMLEAVLCGTWATDTPALGTDQLKAGTTRRSFSILRHFSDMVSGDKPYHAFTGCEFNTLALSVTPDAIVSATFSVVGKAMTTSTTAPAGSTLNAATTTEVLDSFSGQLLENNAQIATITEISLTLENGIAPRFVVGSKSTIRPEIGRSNLSGQITAYFENSLLLDKFIAETPSSIKFSLPDGAGNNLDFIIPHIKYNGGQPDVQGQGAVTLTMPFQALYDVTEQTNLIIERTPV